MRNGHEKSNRRDKTKKPHYWEKWLDEGLQVCSFRGGKVNAVIGEILVSLKDTTRALRFVSEWTIHELLDDKLIHICRSHSGRYKTKFEESLRCNSKSSRLVIKRTPECEFDEIAYWVDSSHHALGGIAAKRRQIRLFEAGTKPKSKADLIAEEFDDAVLLLGRLIDVELVFKEGRLPDKFMESDPAKEVINELSLRMIYWFMQYRNGVDIFLQTREGEK